MGRRLDSSAQPSGGCECTATLGASWSSSGTLRTPGATALITGPAAFEEYLELVLKNPKVARNAFQRIYDMILSYGVEEYIEHKKKIIRYQLLQRSRRTAARTPIFGLDRR